MSGRYRIEAARGAGCLLVLHPGGVGAVVAGAAPGAPDRVDVRPLGEVRLRGAEALFVADVAALFADRDPSYLGRFETRALRLPPGTYRLLIRIGDRLTDTTCRVSEGQRIELDPPRPAPRMLRVADRFAGEIFLADWPGIPLPHADHAVSVPATDGPMLIRLHEAGGPAVATRELWVPTSAEAVDVPAADIRWRALVVVGRDDMPVAGAAVHSLEDSARGPAQLAHAITDASGRAPVAAARERFRVLIRAPGFAHRVVDDPPDGARVRLEPGHEATVQVAPQRPGEDGVEVELAYAANPFLVFAAHTDRRGTARFRDLPAGDAVLRLRSERHLPAAVDVTVPGDGKPWNLAADPGAVIRGRVERAGARPAPGVLVALRDTTASASATRTAYTDDLGHFVFEGLPLDTLFTISAATERAGRTWSAQRRGVQPDDGVCVLVLELEDPPPPRRSDGAESGRDR